MVEANAKGGDWGTEWLSSNEAGSGAYIVDPESYRPQEAIDLERYADHFMGWDDNPNPIDLVRARPVAETSTRVLALIKGDIDATDSYLPTDQVERVEKEDGVHVARDESMRIFLIRMNNQKSPFDNVNARKCFSYAFNYDGFIGDILKNFAERNPAPIPKNLWGYPQDVEGYSFDLEKAKEFCDKARAEGADLDREIEIHIQSALDQTTQALIGCHPDRSEDLTGIPGSVPSPLAQPAGCRFHPRCPSARRGDWRRSRRALRVVLPKCSRGCAWLTLRRSCSWTMCSRCSNVAAGCCAAICRRCARSTTSA